MPPFEMWSSVEQALAVIASELPPAQEASEATLNVGVKRKRARK